MSPIHFYKTAIYYSVFYSPTWQIPRGCPQQNNYLNSSDFRVIKGSVLQSGGLQTFCRSVCRVADVGKWGQAYFIELWKRVEGTGGHAGECAFIKVAELQ